MKALEGLNKGRVIAYRDDIFLTDVSYKVSEAGRQRVLREKAKNVHAGVVGELDESQDNTLAMKQCHKVGTGVSYNPYKNPFFFDVQSGNPCHSQ